MKRSEAVLILVALPVLAQTGAADAHTGRQPPVSSTLAYIDIPRWDGVSEGGGLLLTALAGDGPVLAPYSRFGAVARIGWNDDGLVARVEVTDATPFEAADPERLYDGDSIELYLGAADPKAGMVQLVVSPGRDPAHPEARRKFYDYRDKSQKEQTPASGTATCRRTAAGYRAEIRLPWKNLGVTAQEGLILSARIGVNDGAAGRVRDRLFWLTPGRAYDFWDLPRVRLAAKAGDPPHSVSWAAYDDYTTVRVFTVADRSLVGKPVEVREGGAVRAFGRLVLDGERTRAALSFPAPPVGKTNGPLAVTVDGKALSTLTLPDIEAERQDWFHLGDAPPEWGVPSWVVPHFRSTVFTGSSFPAFGYEDSARIRALVGNFTVRHTYYDASGKPVEKADRPGRYGAVTTITGQSGKPLTLYTTLFRAPDGDTPKPKDDAAARAVAFEAKPGADADPERADHAWWHALRKRLGTAIHYEYAVRLPRGYEDDPAKKWPVICYLHGSGGGADDAWPKVKENDGPNGRARTQADFPFITVTLRSPGGWYPPAVFDVLDEVLQKYRVDPRRQYLTGFSMGGIGTWRVALEQPERFAAIAPVGGREGKPSLAARLKGVGVWVWNGADDTATAATDARRGVAALQAAGVEVRYTEIPNASHTDSLAFAYQQPELYTWLLQHTR